MNESYSIMKTEQKKTKCPTYKLTFYTEVLLITETATLLCSHAMLNIPAEERDNYYTFMKGGD